MKYIITESQALWILRRYNVIKNIIDEALLVFDPNDFSLTQYIDEIARAVTFNKEFSPFYEDGGIRKVSSFVKNNFSDYIKQYWTEKQLD